jgi:hypothetical protein
MKLVEIYTSLYEELDYSDIIFGKNFDLFKDNYKSYNARIKSGEIVNFYLREFLKNYDVDVLDNLENWDEFINMVVGKWEAGDPTGYGVVYRAGKVNDGINFFSDKISVSVVYGKNINAFYLDFRNPFIMDCMGDSYHDLKNPFIKGEEANGWDTDSIVDYVKRKYKKYDGVIFKNIFEGSGVAEFSNVYVTYNKNNIINITNNF